MSKTRIIWLEDDPVLAVREAADELNHGAVVLFPTDTVYGLLAAHDSPAAYQGIYKIKQRAPTQPLQLLIGWQVPLRLEATAVLQEQPELRSKFEAGMTTIVFPADSLRQIPAAVQRIQPGGVGLRVPQHDSLQALLKQSEVAGLTWATSANPSGLPAFTQASEAQDWLTAAKPTLSLAVLSHAPCKGQESEVLLLEEDGTPRKLR